MTIVAPHPLRRLLEVLVNGSTFFILYDILVTFVHYQILQENKILLLNDVIILFEIDFLGSRFFVIEIEYLELSIV